MCETLLKLWCLFMNLRVELRMKVCNELLGILPKMTNFVPSLLGFNFLISWKMIMALKNSCTQSDATWQSKCYFSLNTKGTQICRNYG